MKKLIALLFLVSSTTGLMAQDSVSPPDDMSEVSAYSLFYENYKNDSYKMTIKFGRWIWKGMPETIEDYDGFSLKTNLKRLTKVYSKYAEAQEDPSMEEAYTDTALMIYDRMFEKYPDDPDSYKWYLSQGRMYQTHSNVIDNSSEQAAESYNKAYELKPKEFVGYANGYYIKFLIRQLSSQGKNDKALAIMEEADSYASEGLKSFFSDQRSDLFDSPKEQIAFLEKQVEEDPKNEKALATLRDLYQEEDMVKKERSATEKLYKLKPNYENTMAMADFAINNANNNMAIKYLKEAMKKADSDDQKAEISLKISNSYLNSNQLQSAKRYAKRAMNYGEGNGEPYIKIADIYAQAVSKCTSDRKMGRKDKVVYWLVLDYLDKAKRIDSSTAREVKQKYGAYSDVTPSDEEKFFWKPPLEKGDDIKVDGKLMKCYSWINETTTVR